MSIKLSIRAQQSLFGYSTQSSPKSPDKPRGKSALAQDVRQWPNRTARQHSATGRPAKSGTQAPFPRAL
ncbi:hypothetical protein [Candidatus Desulfovibrio trichonymphae]|uniref:hypothetical protein n=1 Tax=Candidatus Desulfovibrio trichonymphae TaxID=1725232 RepID=UPI0011AB3FB7|nr:hypothetical protein [Candidatus Desulfovibrio trichonymphae]